MSYEKYRNAKIVNKLVFLAAKLRNKTAISPDKYPEHKILSFKEFLKILDQK